MAHNPTPSPHRLFPVLLLVFLALAASAAAQPAFQKSFAPTTIGPGSVSTLRFTITNAAGSPVSDLAFVDNLPAGMTLADPANPSSDCGGTLTTADGGTVVSLAAGSVGGSSVCTITVDVTASAPGTLNNVTGDLTSDAGNSGSASADLTVATNRPGFSKSFSPSSVSFGGRSTLTFTIDNTANASLVFGMAFTDNLPSGMTVASPTNASTDCAAGVVTANSGGNSVAFTQAFGVGILAAGATCSVTVDVIGGNVGTLVNSSGELTSSSGASSQSSGKANAALEVTIDQIALTKSFIDDPVLPGDSVTLEFTILNLNRRSAADAITFTDDLDATLAGLIATGLPLSDPCGSGSSLTGTSVLTLSGGRLAAESSCTFSVTLAVPAAAPVGTYVNTTSTITATVDGRQVTGGAAADQLFITPAPLLTKTFLSNPVGAGSTVTLEFSITNTSASSTASNIAFTDNLGDFLSGVTISALPAVGFCGAGSTLTSIPIGGETALSMAGGSLAPSASCVFTVDLEIPSSASGAFVNTTSDITATVDGDTATGQPASDTLTVVRAPSLSKAFIDDPVVPGDTVTLEFFIRLPEDSSSSVQDIAFTDDLAATLSGLTAIGLPLTDVCGSGSQLSGTTQLSLTGGSLAAGGSCTFSVTLSVPSLVLPGTYSNTTSNLMATSEGAAVIGGAATDDLQVAGLSFEKSFTDDPVIAGGTVTLEFAIHNTSPSFAASDMFFTDNLNGVLSGLVAVAPLPSEPCGAGSAILGTNFLIFTGGNLEAGASCTFSVTLQVPSSASSGDYLNETSNLTANVEGTPVVLDPATDRLVVASDVLQLTKAFTDDPVPPGDEVTLEFTLTNIAGEVATDIAFTDDLDGTLAGLVSSSGTLDDVCGVGSQLAGTDFLTFTGGSLAAGASCTWSVTLTVPADVEPGTIALNETSQVSGVVGGLAVNGDPGIDELQIALLTFSKSFDGEAPAGGTVTLTFSIQNSSESASFDRLSFTDDLDAALSGLEAIGLPIDNVCGEGSSIFGVSTLALTNGSLLPGGSCTFSVVLQIPASTEPGDYTNVTSDLVDTGVRAAGAATATLTVTEPSSILYASDDRDNRDTQVITINLDAGTSTAIGPVHPLADLETLAHDNTTGTLFGITAETGELHQIDKTTGDLTSVCFIPSVRKFREIASSSFHPVTGALWAYQWNRGLVTIDLATCELTREWDQAAAPGLRRKWDGVAWKPDASVLYASQLTELYVWDPATETATVICSNLPNKTEGLEYSPAGMLLGSSDSALYEIDPDTCSVVQIDDFPERQDIESLTFEQ